MRSFPTSGVILVLVLVVAYTTAAGPKGEGRKQGLLVPLEVGQKVSLRERAGGYEIGVIPGVPLGYKVLEVGPDYIVLEDAAGVIETRVPFHAIRAVTVTRFPRDR